VKGRERRTEEEEEEGEGNGAKCGLLRLCCAIRVLGFMTALY
jgi:hypothetical protein